MKWLFKLFNAVPPEQQKGAYLENAKWEITACHNFPDLLKEIEKIMPEGSVLYLEGRSPRDEIRKYLETKKCNNQLKIQIGTIWPKPTIYHMPITSENIKGLVELAENHCEIEPAIHLHTYKDGKLLLQWYDAFTDDPMYITEEISEDKIKEFCNKLNLKYKNKSL